MAIKLNKNTKVTHVYEFDDEENDLLLSLIHYIHSTNVFQENEKNVLKNILMAFTEGLE